MDGTNNQDVSGVTEGSVAPCVIPVGEVLKIPGLKIPVYQRPYKWTEKNVRQLLDDIHEHTSIEGDGKKYRLGTVVVHKESRDKINIVDGQQRLTTLTLLYHCLGDSDRLELLGADYPASISRENIRSNYKYMAPFFRDREDTKKEYQKRLKFCEIVYIELDEIEEAFQFFDSQNSRGKPLEPHDLLKAYHLREMDDNVDKLSYVERWEKSIDVEQGADSTSLPLTDLMGLYLYRTRRWVRGQSALAFTTTDIDEFKGVNLRKHANYRYVKRYLGFNDLGVRAPTSIDEHIVNGTRFFDYVHYYLKLYSKLFGRGGEIRGQDEDPDSGESLYNKVLKAGSYEGWGRVGDTHVRDLFKCALLFYASSEKFVGALRRRQIAKCMI